MRKCHKSLSILFPLNLLKARTYTEVKIVQCGKFIKQVKCFSRLPCLEAHPFFAIFEFSRCNSFWNSHFSVFTFKKLMSNSSAESIWVQICSATFTNKHTSSDTVRSQADNLLLVRTVRTDTQVWLRFCYVEGLVLSFQEDRSILLLWQCEMHLYQFRLLNPCGRIPPFLCWFLWCMQTEVLRWEGHQADLLLIAPLGPDKLAVACEKKSV